MEINSNTAFTVKSNIGANNFSAIKARQNISETMTASGAGSSNSSISDAARTMAKNDRNVQPGTHDFANMTPNQMHDAAQDLYKSGKIDLTQLLMLQTAGVPIGRQGANGEFVPLSESEKASYSSKPMDYVQAARDAIKFLEQAGLASDPKSGAEQWKGILAALQGITSNSTV